MKNEKKFKFDAKQAELISKSFNDFKNDTLKNVVANSTVGGAAPIHGFSRSWGRVIIY